MSLRAGAVVLLAAVLLPACAGKTPDFDLDELTEAHPAFARGLLKYGRHLRHRHASKPSLLHHVSNVGSLSDAALDESLEAELEGTDAPVQIPMTLPGRHASVEKALDGMAGDLVTLKASKLAAKDSRSQLEGTVTDAFQHMNDAMTIKHAMQKKESQLRIETGKLQALENDAGRLESTEHSLVNSLHRMLGPKLMFAKERFQKKEMVLRKEENAARAWKEKQDQLKASAMELIAKKKTSYQTLLEAEAAVAQAKKMEEMARLKYERDRTQTAEQVQSYRYAETRYKAEIQHEKSAKAAAMAARESMMKLHNVEGVEQEKVDQSIAFRKERLRRKIQQVTAERQRSSQELNDLSKKYREWQEKQRERTAEVVKKGRDTAAASDAFAAQQQQVLDAAQRKVVREAEGAGDWDGWDDTVTKVQDELDD